MVHSMSFTLIERNLAFLTIKMGKEFRTIKKIPIILLNCMLIVINSTIKG